MSSGEAGSSLNLDAMLYANAACTFLSASDSHWIGWSKSFSFSEGFQIFQSAGN